MDQITASGRKVFSATIACLALSMLLSSLGTSIANVALPTLAESFTASIQAVQWVVLSYLLAITSLIVGAGRLADVIGNRRLMIAGLTVFSIASAACGLAPSLESLIAARVVQGAAAATLMAVAMALAGGAVAKSRIGTAMGLLASTSAIGTALGPSLGGLLIELLGWRSLFLVNLPLALLGLWLAYRYLPADAPRSDDRPCFDMAGTLLLAVSLATYALAMTRASAQLMPLLLFAAAVLGGLFVMVQARAPSPLLQLALLHDGRLGRRLAANALVSTIVMATLVVGPFYLADGLHLDPAEIGLLMSVGPVVAALGGAPAGRMTDRFGARGVAIAGLALMVAGSLGLASAPTGVLPYAAALATLTAGYALFQTANNSAVMADVEGGRRGVVSGLLNLSRNLGLITGASAMAALYATVSPAAAGLNATFAVAAALAGLAALLVIAVRRTQPSIAAISEALPPAAVVSMQVTRSVAKRAT